MLRFRLLHLFAFTTLSAVLLSVGAWTGSLKRDDIWEVVSIEERTVFELSDGPATIVYIATLRDGDRARYVWLGEKWAIDPSQVSSKKMTLVLNGNQNPLGKSVLAASFPVYAGAMSDDPIFFDIDQNTRFLPAQTSEGYSPILNVTIVFVWSAIAVVFVALLLRFSGWLSKALSACLERCGEKRERYRRTHIV